MKSACKGCVCVANGAARRAEAGRSARDVEGVRSARGLLRAAPMFAGTFALITSTHLTIVLGLWLVATLVALGGSRSEARARARKR